MERASLIVPNVYVVVFPSGRRQGAAFDHSSSLWELTETAFGAALLRLRPLTLLPPPRGKDPRDVRLRARKDSHRGVSLHFLWSSCRGFMRGVPVLASDSGYYPRSGMLPLARSSRYSNLRPEFGEIMLGILWLQRMVFRYSIEPCRITSRDSKKNCCRLSWGEPGEH
jgi:hypothetical protein